MRYVLPLICLLLSAASDAEEPTIPADSTAVEMTQVVVPLHLDYPLLEELLTAQLFTGPGNSQDVLNDPSGCNQVRLSAPQLSTHDAKLQFVVTLSARVGVGIGGRCTGVANWRGRIGIDGYPQVRDKGSTLGFEPDNVWLIDAAGNPIVNPVVQPLAEAGVRATFDRFAVDLEPQLQSVAAFLPEVLPRHSRQQIETLLGTLRVVGLRATEQTLDANLAFSIEPLKDSLTPERALTEAELQQWEERWQLMDSLLVLAVKHYAATTQLQDLRDALLDVLIESRYRLGDALADTPVTGSDRVRTWFLQSWDSLAPTLRRIGLEQPGNEHLVLLSVIAATDALDALDELGPSVGLEISSDGLRRLARMIIGGEGDALLQYSKDVDPELRQLFNESLGALQTPTGWRLDFSLFPQAVAAEADRLNSWAPKRQDLPEYLPLVGTLLNRSAQAISVQRKLDPAYRELFRHLVLTTAWQESCWRHYTVSDDRKLVPLRSGTGDVGLMQINEQVWRGFYDQQRLRWDIHYNSDAGAEVLVDYLIKYAIRKGEHRQPGGLSNLARASYSAYNGGPSKVARYRSSTASPYGKTVDEAFWDKYQQVAAGNELGVSSCLGGSLSGPVRSSGGNPPAVNDSPGTASNPYTLQIGAFTTQDRAKSFIQQHSLSPSARVFQRGGDHAAQYLVLYGTYATRDLAEAARAGLIRFEPWIRRHSDL